MDREMWSYSFLKFEEERDDYLSNLYQNEEVRCCECGEVIDISIDDAPLYPLCEECREMNEKFEEKENEKRN